MQELEKILEEIEKLRGQVGSECTLEDHYIKRAWEHCLDRVEYIIRKHMNNGWIPVEERLPEESGYYLVQLSEKLPNEDYSDRVVVLYSEEDKDFMCYSSLIIAWRSLPESYRPERSEE